MKYVLLPEQEGRRLSFYLAMEEYVARHLDEDDLFFMWQVAPSVIFGRNQLIDNEVNIDYCSKNNIQVFRRKSGGGCVYADMGNVMFSYVTRTDQVNLAFNRYVGMVMLVLRKLGLETISTTHNDILIGERKVSGTACYHLGDRSIVHATMLYDTNMDHMLHAITPSKEKLLSKGVQSVRQRITLLKDYLSVDLETFKAFVRSTLCDGELWLTKADVEAIGRLEQSYNDIEFITMH